MLSREQRVKALDHSDPQPAIATSLYLKINVASVRRPRPALPDTLKRSRQLSPSHIFSHQLILIFVLMFLIQMTIQAATANKSKDASRAGQLLGISIADTNSHKQVFCFQPSPQAGATDDALSPVCIIQFSSSTDSQLYRWQIVCLIALVFIEAVVIAALIIQWRWRKDAENALRRNEELFRAIVEDQTEMIIRWKPDGTRTFVNQAYCRFLGKRPEELIGSSFFPLVLAEADRERIRQKILSLTPDHPVATDAHECISTDGEIYMQEWTDRGIFDAQGRLVELQSTGRDITERRRAEDALIGIALLDEEGHSVQSNPALQQMLGYTGDELRKMPCTEFTHPEDVNKDDYLYDELVKGQRSYYQIEKRYIRKDGQVVWGNLTVSTLNHQRTEQKLFIGMLEDITERKRAEDENHKLLHDLGERVKELTALHAASRILQQEWTDTAKMLSDLAALLPSAFQYPKISAARIRIGSVEAVTPGFNDSQPVLRADFITAGAETGSIEVVYSAACPPEFEGPFLREERSLINTLADMLQTAYDHHEAEAALRESEGRFRQLTENIREVFWMNKLDYSELLYISPAYETVWGRTRESLYENSRSFLDAIHPDDRVRAKTIIEQGGMSGFELQYRIVRPDGSIRWIWDRGFPVKNDAGQVYCIAGIAEDITERKRAEEQLKATSEQLRALMARLRSAKEEEGIRIAREIHDELGSALTSLRWDLEEIDRTLTETPSQQPASMVHEKIEGMLELINDTVNAIRRISSELRPGVLDDLGLVEAIEWQAQQFQARTGIKCHYDSLVENTHFDHEQSTAIFRIFQEALTNVLRHAQATEVSIKLEVTEGELVLTIADNGRGISESEKLGLHSLGLLGMQERAHLIGGTVEIAGGEGMGTTVTLRAPVLAQAGY